MAPSTWADRVRVHRIGAYSSVTPRTPRDRLSSLTCPESQVERQLPRHPDGYISNGHLGH